MKQLINIKNHEGEMVVTSREVAENFEKEPKHVNEAIRKLIAENSTVKNMIIESTYISSRGREEKEYLLTRDGFTLLAMGFTGGKAIEWKLKYIDAFNKMEQALKEQSKPTCIEDLIIMQAQSLKDMREQVNQANYHALEAKAEAEKSREEIQGMRDLVALTPNAWRKDTAAIINKIANKLGGFEHIRDVREESYRILDETFKVDVKRRLQNKKKNMALEGVSKSKIDKLNPLDVIAEDEKLINGYLSIVSKMAIKNGIV